VGLPGQFLVFAGPGVGGGQLVALEAEQGALAPAVLGGLDQLQTPPAQGGVGLALLP
jgi:hypothetical protein